MNSELIAILSTIVSFIVLQKLVNFYQRLAGKSVLRRLDKIDGHIGTHSNPLFCGSHVIYFWVCFFFVSIFLEFPWAQTETIRPDGQTVWRRRASNRRMANKVWQELRPFNAQMTNLLLLFMLDLILLSSYVNVICHNKIHRSTLHKYGVAINCKRFSRVQALWIVTFFFLRSRASNVLYK